MGAFKDLLHSEKGIIGVVLLIAITVLAAIGTVTVEQWTDYTKWIFGIYVAGKTVQSAMSKLPTSETSATSTTTVTTKEA